MIQNAGSTAVHSMRIPVVHNSGARIPRMVACMGLLCLLACSKPTELPTVTSKEADFAHEHKHQHGSGQVHDHEHKDFKGSHSHPHPHGHRHEGGVQGGIIISIGHDRHTESDRLFHAEILPIRDRKLAFILSLENPERLLEPYSIEQEELSAYVSAVGSSTSKVTEVRFESVGGRGTRFEAVVPEGLQSSDSLNVVVTKIELEGEAHSFRFVASMAEVAEEGDKPSTSTATEESGS